MNLDEVIAVVALAIGVVLLPVSILVPASMEPAISYAAGCLIGGVTCYSFARARQERRGR